MKGDFSRSTFRKDRHFTSVRQQQGRVQIDADGNEAQDIAGHRMDVTTLDVIGPAGAPLDPAASGFAVSAAGTTLTLSPGRFYVDGVLVENEAPVALPAQPQLSGGWALLPDGMAQFGVATPAAGDYAVVLDVWPRHVTPLELPDLIEPALGGVDTATRVQTVWQAKLMPIPAGTTCAAVKATPAWIRHATPSGGRLLAEVDPAPTPANVCDLSPSGGYQGVENQLYRVEVHDGGAIGTPPGPSFKWARDNASVATTATEWDGDRTIGVASVGRDFSSGWRTGDTIEILDLETEYRGLPGKILTIADIDGTALTLSAAHGLGAAAAGAAAADRFVRIRRWAAAPVRIPTTNTVVKLGDDGLNVSFRRDAGTTYRTGDYWTIPARTAHANILWPGGFQPPEGIGHHLALLARVRVAANGTMTLLADCRDLFPPLTAMIEFGYAGGDGQQAEPNPAGITAPIPLPFPLVASVTRGKLPVAGAQVSFAIEAGAAGQVVSPVMTNGDGLAISAWSLDATVGDAAQKVVARLLDEDGTAIAAPIRYGARVLGLLEMRLNGGDTQTVSRQAGDNAPIALPVPLSVAVLHGGRPAGGRTVRFEILSGGGTLAGGGTTLDVASDPVTGIAACDWTLDPTQAGHSVRARLLTDTGTAWGLPDVTFTANVLTETEQGGCDVTIGKGGQFPTLAEAIKALRELKLLDLCLCLLPGDHKLGQTLTFQGNPDTRLMIHGCGAATRLALDNSRIEIIGLDTFELRDIALTARTGSLIIARTNSATLRGVLVDIAQKEHPPFLTVEACAALTVERCTLRGGTQDDVMIAVDSFVGRRLFRDNQLDGWILFGDGERIPAAKLREAVTPRRTITNRPAAAGQPAPPTNILSIGGNSFAGVTLSVELGVALAKDSSRMPFATTLETNLFLAAESAVPGERIVIQGNAFTRSGDDLLAFCSVLKDETPNIKAVANTGPVEARILVVGFVDESLNRPIVFA